MNFKKKVNGSWVETPNYIHKTDTDTFTTLPAVLYPNDTSITVGLKGNEEHTGTPSPQNPVDVNGTGDRTGNLFDINRTVSTSFTTNTNYYMDGAYANSTTVSSVNADITITNGILTVRSKAGGCGAGFLVEVNPNTTYTLSFDTDKTATGSYFGFNMLTANLEMSKYVAVQYKTYTFTTDANIKYAYFVFRIPPDDGIVQYSNIMLNTGSTALPYEPYGYKIPISSANTTTPVYLGEVETTRKIRKLVLTGQEEWFFYEDVNIWQFYTNGVGLGGIARSSAMSNIAPYGATADSRQYYERGCYLVTGGNDIGFQMIGSKDTFTNITSWKSYLAAQYAAGTPVCVWYILANETTGIVNEPLMRIGDYSDKVSGISIPTIAGADSFDVLTTLKPSEVTVNYKGWHPAIVHERTNGAWT